MKDNGENDQESRERKQIDALVDEVRRILANKQSDLQLKQALRMLAQ